MADNKKTILVVDDDHVSAYICSKFLEPDYMVIGVTSGKEAIEIVKNTLVDLILLDIVMPVMDGFAVYDEIRQCAEGMQIPIVFITGMLDKPTITTYRDKGADGILVKPLKKDILLNKISEVLAVQVLPKSGKRILVIDDDVEFLHIMKIYLGELYDVMAVSTSQTAIKYLEDNAPDVIMVDYYMPQYNGADLIRLIKTSTMARSSKVILVSGSMDADILKECINMGVDSAISKMAPKEEFIMKIQEVLER